MSGRPSEDRRVGLEGATELALRMAACSALWLTQTMSERRRAKWWFHLKVFMCGCQRGNAKIRNTEKVQILWSRICKCSLLNPWWRAGKGGQCVCVCVMWKTNEHCNVGYQPSPALLFLRANPAASPPLPPPPQPPQKLYNAELLSLCYLTPTTHCALPAWWETEEQRREEEWEHRRPREEKVGWYQLKLALGKEKEKKKVCSIFHIVVLLL